MPLGARDVRGALGLDAMTFVNARGRNAMHLRGINARVVRPGAFRVGDTVAELSGGS